MFTLLRNYRTLFMLTVTSNLAGGEKINLTDTASQALEKADDNSDGLMTMSEYNNLTEGERKKLQRKMDRNKIDPNKYDGASTQWEYFEAKNQIRYKAAQEATQTARLEQQDHKKDIGAEVGEPLVPTQAIQDVLDAEKGIIPKFEKNTFQRTLEKGTEGADVKALQKFLTEAGFDARYKGEYDGDFGGGTQKALAAYQKANNLPVSGKLAATKTTSSKTLNHMLVSIKPLSRAEQRQAERAERNENEAKGNSAESNEVSKFKRTLRKGLKGTDVSALQVILTNKGYDTKGTEGIFGPGTEAALKKYQQEVLGQRGDGIMDLNGTTMKSILGGVEKISGVDAPKKGKTFKEFTAMLFGHRLNTHKLSALSAMDDQINARDNKNLHSLDEAIKSVSSSTDLAEIKRVYNLVKNSAEFKKALNQDTYKLFSSARNETEMSHVLGFVSNALMGGESSRNAVDKGTSKERVSSLKKAREGAFGLMSGIGASPALIEASKMHTNEIINALNSGVKIDKKSANIRNGELAFSTRTKGSSKLQAFSSGAMDYILGAIDVPETKQDQKIFIDHMSIAQLKEISKTIGVGVGTNYEDFKGKLKKMVDSTDEKKGIISFDIKMVIADNCNNVSYIAAFNYKKEEVKESNDSDSSNEESRPGRGNPADIPDVTTNF